jgi:hypothetical protein
MPFDPGFSRHQAVAPGSATPISFKTVEIGADVAPHQFPADATHEGRVADSGVVDWKCLGNGRDQIGRDLRRARVSGVRTIGLLGRSWLRGRVGNRDEGREQKGCSSQWSPLEGACRAQCQTPFLFLMCHRGFRRDAPGCLLLWLRHGAYCVGCCRVLMALLLVGSVMNVLWIAPLASRSLGEAHFDRAPYRPLRWHSLHRARCAAVVTGMP